MIFPFSWSPSMATLARSLLRMALAVRRTSGSIRLETFFRGRASSRTASSICRTLQPSRAAFWASFSAFSASSRPASIFPCPADRVPVFSIPWTLSGRLRSRRALVTAGRLRPMRLLTSSWVRLCWTMRNRMAAASSTGFRSSRCRFSIRDTSWSSCSSLSVMTAGTVLSPASRAAR